MRYYELTLFADYHQFYIQDEKVDGDLSEAWTDTAIERLLAVAPGTVGIGTVSNSDVTVTIAVSEHEPLLDADKFDHVVECSIALESGTIVAAGCTDYFPDAVRINMPTGSYRVRASFEGLESVCQWACAQRPLPPPALACPNGPNPGTQATCLTRLDVMSHYPVRVDVCRSGQPAAL